jgi:Ca2+/Na+ antiporter
MKQPKFRPTSLDIALSALSIGLIISMIASLVFFFVILVYQGQYSIRLMYILGLFTFASVLVARISIEQSRGLSLMYLSVLSLATLMVTLRFVAFSGPLAILSLPITVLFLALIVFLADRITYDCTLIDENQDASGEGLLQSLGVVKSQINADDKPPRTTVANQLDSIKQAVKEYGSDQISGDDEANDAPKRHNPGVWVLYFALLALPLFGLGQLLLPATDTVSNSRAFTFLFFYLLSALLLLLTTSFLGLRRYLRQRAAPMPASMATLWVGGGTAATLLLLVVATFLPLPGHSAGLFELPDFLTSRQDLQASKTGWGPEGVENDQSAEQGPTAKKNQDNGKDGTGQAREDGRGDSGEEDSNASKTKSGGKEKGQSKSKSNQSDQSDSSTQSQDSKKSNEPPEQSNNSKSDSNQNLSEPDKKQSKPGEQPPEKDQQQRDPQKNQQSDPNQPREQGKNDRGGQEQPSPKNQNRDSQTQTDNPTSSFKLPTGLSGIIKWLTILGLLLVIVIYALRHPDEVATMWLELLNFFRTLFGGSRQSQESSEKAPSTKPVPAPQVFPAFASFADPFRTSSVRWKSIDLMRHTFDALQAWARETDMPRTDQETPEEFLRRLARKYPSDAGLLTSFAQLYNRSAYASQKQAEVAPVKSIWEWMQRHATF